MYKNIDKQTKLNLKDLVEYQEGQVVSKTLVQNDYVSMTIFSFDKGEEISTHESGGDAFVTCLDGTGEITINGRDIDEYFGLETLKMVVRQPLSATDTLGKVDIVATVEGGGVSGQAGALRHGISRALLLVNPEYRAVLKKAGFLTRDPRMKERKKYGLKAARRAPQFSKR